MNLFLYLMYYNWGAKVKTAENIPIELREVILTKEL